MLEYGGPLRDSLRLDSSYDTRCFYISPTPLRGVVAVGKSGVIEASEGKSQCVVNL